MKLPRRPAPEPAQPEPVRRDEDLDFAALMQQEGVTPAPRRASKSTPHQAAIASKSAPRPGPGRVAAGSGAGKSVPGPGVAGSGAGKSAAGAGAGRVIAAGPGKSAHDSGQSAPGSTLARGPVGPDVGELAARVAAIVRERDAALVEVTRERDAALVAITALKAELAALTDRNASLIRERDAAITLRDAASATQAALRAELLTARAARQAPEPTGTLAAALQARGLPSAAEQAQALAVLLAGESATRLLELLVTRDPSALASLLERRLALVCGDPGCAPELGAAALQVLPARCEVCGGSDIQRAAHGFVRACLAADIVRVRFVGGSPNYRTKLAALFPAGGPLTVHTTLGDKRVRLQRSRSQQRGDDLVIIWGATELDHATSGAYRAEYGRTEVIAHRGIGRMLELAAARIAGAPPGRSLRETDA